MEIPRNEIIVDEYRVWHDRETMGGFPLFAYEQLDEKTRAKVEEQMVLAMDGKRPPLSDDEIAGALPDAGTDI